MGKSFSQRHPLDYEGSAGLRCGDPRSNAQALALVIFVNLLFKQIYPYLYGGGFYFVLLDVWRYAE